MIKFLIYLSIFFTLQACQVDIERKFQINEDERSNSSPENVSPDIYKVLYENDDYIILEATFEPGQGDNLHTHSDMFYYVIQGSMMQITSEDGEVFTAELKSGDFQKQKSTTHQVTNIGSTTARIIAIEEK